MLLMCFIHLFSVVSHRYNSFTLLHSSISVLHWIQLINLWGNKMTNVPVVRVSDDWQYEDLAILSAEGCRARGRCAVVVVYDDRVYVYSWIA